MALSLLNPEPPLDPAVQRKITLLQMIGLPGVLALFLAALASFPMGYLPRWVAGVATGAETLLCWYVLRKIYLLRKSS
jgi:hypothetical protein